MLILQLWRSALWLAALLIAAMSVGCGGQPAPAATPTPTVAVFLQDEFTDVASGWRETKSDQYTAGYHPPDFYHIEVGTPDDRQFVYGPPPIDDLTDFTVETAVDVLRTDSENGDFRYGLVVRGTGDRFYGFMISPRTKTWVVVKGSPDGLVPLKQGADAEILGPSVKDRLRIDASGSTLTFHINDRPVAQVTDSDYARGAVGFIVQSLDEPRPHIHYDWLVVRPVEQVALVFLTDTPIPTDTPMPTDTPLPPTSTPIPLPPGMQLVSAGFFQMGSSGGRADEAPEHPVLLDAFYVDRFEVSNAEYRACVNAGACTPGQRDGFTRARYRDDPTFDNYPVVGVTWNQATAYCQWAGKRLPSEAEWEYAASGLENRVWPWGNTFDASLSAASAPDTQPVESYPDGASPFGVYNLAGNVTEWVEDIYDAAFYANSPASNPVNGGSDAHVHRGGSFANVNGENYTTSRRYRGADTDVDIGFRCAKDAPEENAAVSPEARDQLVADFCQIYSAYKPGAACP